MVLIVPAGLSPVSALLKDAIAAFCVLIDNRELLEPEDDVVRGC